MSDDKSRGVVVIAFVGSVFSPFYYAERARRGEADPMDFCAFNVAVYDGGKRAWGFTEWHRDEVTRTNEAFHVGANRITQDADKIVIAVDEACATGKGRVVGEIILHSKQGFDRAFSLDASGVHRWHPVAPLADIEVNLSEPALGFRGTGYHDANIGDEPLEASIRRWSWSRHEVEGGETAVLYDGTRVDDSPFSLALRFKRDGTIDEMAPPPLVKLPSSFWWRCPRTTRSEGAVRPRVLRTLEDSPFYSRTLLECTLFGERTPGVHESLALDRFTTKWMQWMLPYRIIKAP
jgi:carotenoid 1,2-hydratase